jgi:2-dehydro-3-deoxygluconokinase
MAANVLRIKAPGDTRWDCASLGEVMLRFDPGFGRVRNARSFQVWEGGGEYNVARAMRKCWGKRSTVVTALPVNDLGWLVEDLIMQGGVDLSHVIWREFDGIGRNTRVGLNFTEKGFGIRAALGCPDRGHSAASQIKPGEINWEKLFGEEGVRWFHTGGIFAALGSNTAETVIEAAEAARRHDTIVSYDLNYRASLWKSQGGKEGARRVNRSIAKYVDVMIGNVEDFTDRVGFEVEALDEHVSAIDPANFKNMIQTAVKQFPNLKVAATTLRNAKTATFNDWSAILYTDGQFYQSVMRENLEIYDRIGGGDGFASGLAYAFLEGKSPQVAVEYGAAHGALAMTTPGDTSMVDAAEVEAVMKGKGARVIR